MCLPIRFEHLHINKESPAIARVDEIREVQPVEVVRDERRDVEKHASRGLELKSYCGGCGAVLIGGGDRDADAAIFFVGGGIGNTAISSCIGPLETVGCLEELIENSQRRLGWR